VKRLDHINRNISQHNSYHKTIKGAIVKKDIEEKKEIKAWITKQALTAGILLVNGTISQTTPSTFCYKVGHFDDYAHGEGKDWHRTPESAITRAEVLRKAKIASIKKNLANWKKWNSSFQ
jgi:hypothetical protein